MNDQQKRAGQSTREMAERRYKNRVWFVLLTMGVVFLMLLAVYNSNALGISSFGVLELIVAARVIRNYADAKTKRMIKEEKRAARGANRRMKRWATLTRE